MGLKFDDEERKKVRPLKSWTTGQCADSISLADRLDFGMCVFVFWSSFIRHFCSENSRQAAVHWAQKLPLLSAINLPRDLTVTQKWLIFNGFSFITSMFIIAPIRLLAESAAINFKWACCGEETKIEHEKLVSYFVTHETKNWVLQQQK